MRAVPAEEMKRQERIAATLSDGWMGGRYHIVTYGCQMNAHESETMAGTLERIGLVRWDAREEADVLLFNTCCVRESAEKRLFGNIGKLREAKERNPEMLIGVCGCMMQQQGVGEKLLKRYPFVDFVLGTQGTHRLPEILQEARSGRFNAVAEDLSIPEGLPVRRSHPNMASVSIMYGCENFCSYCIVPYVRGAERSRDHGAVIADVERLAKEGVKEVLLLGQNVNSYQGGLSFAQLLRRLNGVVPRIRFMTSHPKDLSDALIEAMAECPSVMEQLHLPVQSGSDEVLRRMNRGYTSKEYIALVERVRQAMPNIGLTADVIVGFPGETEEQFLQTLDLYRSIRYDAAYMFAYSARRGTPAAQLPEQVGAEVKRERLSRLIQLKEETTAKALEGLIGTEDDMLVEGPSRRGGGVTGRTDRGMTINIAQQAQAGDIRRVRITGTGRNTIRGEFVQ